MRVLDQCYLGDLFEVTRSMMDNLGEVVSARVTSWFYSYFLCVRRPEEACFEPQKYFGVECFVHGFPEAGCLSRGLFLGFRMNWMGRQGSLVVRALY